MGWTRRSLLPLTVEARPAARLGAAFERSARGGAEIAGKLNLFQQTMLRWRELHPYSAAHAVRLAVALEATRLERSIARQLAAIGATGLAPDAPRGVLLRTAETGSPTLKVLAEERDPQATLWSEFEAELNTPFARSGPFRFFALPAGDGFYLALVYDHFVAGGDAIALLLKAIVDDYSDTGAPKPTPPAPQRRLAPPRYRRLLLRHPLHAAWALLRLPSMVGRSRRSVRPPGASGRDPYNALAYQRVGAADAEGLRRAAAAWGVTLNDLLLASLLLALAPLAPERARAQRRRELAVASIVNIRQDLPEAADTFGPFLASFDVSHPVPAGITLRRLAQDVHAESGRIRRQRLYLQTIVAQGVAALMWPLLSPLQRERFFPKYHPVWGGVSMLNLKPLWERAGTGADVPADYVRAISTGPACPLVLAVTVAREVLHVGVSFRRDAFPPATVATVTAAFAGAIATLRDGPSE
jgi:hypothetical protein